jgi:hypothetical protein
MSRKYYITKSIIPQRMFKAGILVVLSIAEKGYENVENQRMGGKYQAL